MQKKKASIKYKSALEELRRKELKDQQAANAEQSNRAELQLHTVIQCICMCKCLMGDAAVAQ